MDLKSQYPEGLTAIISIGGTRTAYILAHNRNKPEPGKIEDMRHYMEWGMEQLTSFMLAYFELGGANVIAPTFSFYRFIERSSEYIDLSIEMQTLLVDETRQHFYRENNIDPYFGGMNELLNLPQHSPAYTVGQMFAGFAATWDYQPGRRKLIWEIASMPLWTFFNAETILEPDEKQQLETRLHQTQDWQEKNLLLYQYYCKALYGTEIPIPAFYLGDARNGDLKLRAHTFALDVVNPTRLFYLPYPAFVCKLEQWREILQEIINNLLIDKRLRSDATDYDGILTTETIDNLQQHFGALMRANKTTIGLII